MIAVAGIRVKPGRVEGWTSQGAVAVPERYLLSLHRAGADEGVLLPRPLSDGDAGRILDRFDGLMLMGGGDIDPRSYGGALRDEVYDVDADRDAFEIALVREAIERDLPVLAICRGMQVLNVALGGTLDQHLPDHDDLIPHRRGGTRGHVMHDVRLAQGSRAAGAMATERPACSSSHHQGLEKLGDGLVATGWADDGVIEAVEHERGWVVGVQWHPEITSARDPAQQGLFDALAQRARDAAR